MMSDTATVAVINTAQETTEILRSVLAEAGYRVVTAFTYEFKTGQRDFKQFVAEHRPRAIVYDIALPYTMNWAFFRDHILGSQVVPEQCFVLTTANKSILDILVGPTPTIELIGRPLDLQEIVTAVGRAVASSQKQ